FCERCHEIFLTGDHNAQCPKGGGHSAQAGSLSFVLPHTVPNANPAQSNWRYCQACCAMFFAGYGGGLCPVGGKDNGWGGPDFILPYTEGGFILWQSVSSEVKDVPWGKYIDQFTEIKYDMNYKIPPDQSFAYSAILQLKYFDGMPLEIDMEKDIID